MPTKIYHHNIWFFNLICTRLIRLFRDTHVAFVVTAYLGYYNRCLHIYVDGSN